MCGIIAFIPKDINFKLSGKRVAEQYQRQHNRGSRGFGLMGISKNGIQIDRSVEPTKALLDCYMNTASIPVFHHRMPTSTDNEIEQTHPFKISHGELQFDWHIIHNGVIRNAEVLRKEHMDELGYTYETYTPSVGTKTYSSYKDFNDSEALAIEVARYFEGRSESIGAYGTIAFIAVKADKKTGKPLEILWGRNGGNPLEVVELPEGLLIASAIYHEDAEIITQNTFEVINLKKYFAAKTPFESIISLIKAGDCAFKEEPKIIPATSSFPSLPSATSANGVGFGAGRATSVNLKDEDEEEEDIQMDAAHSGYSTPREAAFEKMAVRLIEDISEEIYDFCADMAYRHMTEDDILNVASKVQDFLIERSERADEKVRPHFDRREDEDLAASYPGMTDEDLGISRHGGEAGGYLENDEDEEMAVTNFLRHQD